MKKEKKDKGYELIAEEGKELILTDETGEELVRAKTVYVPPEGTKNKWKEVKEKLPPPPPPPPTPEELLAKEIEETEEKLARLKERQSKEVAYE